ncbi:uncharacterized protein LOC143665275 isoform X2 [Tamandua tetradactyla]|uniref:uncharacterized protein LOC143665275 isoform X2 n=1 Tax=Tamandua tetradactyla TaxID=48850 RepID=UPI00405408D8
MAFQGLSDHSTKAAMDAWMAVVIPASPTHWIPVQPNRVYWKQMREQEKSSMSGGDIQASVAFKTHCGFSMGCQHSPSIRRMGYSTALECCKHTKIVMYIMEKIFQIAHPTNDSHQGYRRNFQTLTEGKQTDLKVGKDLNNQFAKEEIWKSCSH